MPATKIGPKHQITIPKEVFERFDLEVGDFLEVKAKDNYIAIIPKKLIPKNQAWFYTEEWQKKEREADEAIVKKEVSRPFSTAEGLIAHLRKNKKRS